MSKPHSSNSPAAATGACVVDLPSGSSDRAPTVTVQPENKATHAARSKLYLIDLIPTPADHVP
ncbi:hypothetical protein [Flindersiella endophytica]